VFRQSVSYRGWMIGLVAAGLAAPASGQSTGRGLEIGGFPAVNYDSDEGYGFGAVAELYHYGDGGVTPYVWTLQPTVFATTEGRRDFTLFFDAPHLLGGGWRLDAWAGSERHIATPYYGWGNDAEYDETRVTDANPSFYRYGRTRRRLAANLQRDVSGLPVRVLFGVGMTRTSVEPVPKGEGTTRYAQEVVDDPDVTEVGWSNHVRVGLVWDTRDRETAPSRGSWTELIVQVVDEALASDWSYTRWTLTDRRYFGLGSRLVLAHRILLQGTSGHVPIRDAQVLQTSFKQQEALGGAKSVRGVLKNRYVGKGMLVWNIELRWRAVDFRLLERSFHVTLSMFLDSGRVWAESIDLGDLWDDHHRGVGGGIRLGMGNNFTVAFDAATSEETGLPLYIGLGYLY
jgi:outer membrane protein assembly factor BamA